MAASGAKLGMDSDTAGTIQQCRSIAAMYSTEGIVHTAIGCSLEHRMAALHLGQVQTEFVEHRALRLLDIMA